MTERSENVSLLSRCRRQQAALFGAVVVKRVSTRVVSLGRTAGRSARPAGISPTGKSYT